MVASSIVVAFEAKQEQWIQQYQGDSQNRSPTILWQIEKSNNTPYDNDNNQ